MSFLNPILLAGLAAVSVPIILHLLNRRKFQPMRWAAMRFLQAGLERNRRRMRLEDWLLLITRCLLVALLALVLARPTWPGSLSGIGRGPVMAILLLDHSLSMSTVDGNQTRFEKARAAALEIIDSLPMGSEAAIWMVSDRTERVVSEPTSNLGLVRKAIEEARPTDRSTDLLVGLSEGMQALSHSSSGARVLFLVTDDAAYGWRQREAIERALISAGDQVKCQVLLIRDQVEDNLALSSFAADSDLATVGRPLRFKVELNNHGRTEMRDVRVKLAIDRQPPSDEVVVPVLPAGSSRNISFFAKLAEPGFHSITLSSGSDALERDNQRHLVLRALKELKVLLVDGDPGTQERESETFFLNHALRPVSPETRGRYPVKTTVTGSAGLGSISFTDHDLVILANLRELNLEWVRRLSAFVEGGGGLMIFPGSRIEAARYNQFLGPHGLLPARLGSFQGDERAEDKYFSLADRGYDHPVVSLWSDPSAGSLSSARFFRRVELDLSNTPASSSTSSNSNSNAEVLLRYSDHQPAVVSSQHGAGRILLFSSSADTEWNDFSVRPAFVPFLHRALAHLLSQDDRQLNVEVGRPFYWTLAREMIGREVLFHHRQAADQTAVLSKVQWEGDLPAIRFTNTDWGGVYEASLGTGTEVLRFAAQSDREESNLQPLLRSYWERLGSLAQIQTWAPGSRSHTSPGRGKSTTEFALPLLVVLSALVLLELWMAHRFSRSKVGASGGKSG